MAGLFLLAVGSSAWAQTVVLTGGDAGQGLTLNAANVVTARNVGSASSFTVQGVSFTGQTGLGSGGDYAVSFGYPGGSENSANDLALRSVVQSLAFAASGSGGINLTLTGLAANGAYHIDLIQSVGSSYNPREQAIAINGVFQTFVSLTKVMTSGYVSGFDVNANGSGTITVQLVNSSVFGGSGAQDGAVLNGYVLTAVPEPAATVGWIGAVGLVAAMAWRRRIRHGAPETRGAGL